MVLLVVALVVLGPHRLPEAARTIAGGLARIRRLADVLATPVKATLEQPRQVIDSAKSELRAALEPPAPGTTEETGPSVGTGQTRQRTS
jgi:Sec-independent protein translocase protein TatA